MVMFHRFFVTVYQRVTVGWATTVALSPVRWFPSSGGGRRMLLLQHAPDLAELGYKAQL